MAVYFVMNDSTHDIKIGTSSSPRDRLKALQTGCPDRLVLLGWINGGHAEEKALHIKFARFRKQGGEWFVGLPMLLVGVGKVIGADIVIDNVVIAARKKSRGDVAVDWLIERFRERREWRSDEIRASAVAAGISKNAIWSAQVSLLPIVKRAITGDDGVRFWVWRARSGWPDESVDVLSTVASLEAAP